MEKISEKKIIFAALVFFTAAAALIKLDSLIMFLGKTFSLLMPLLTGFLTAALLSTPVNAVNERLTKTFPKISERAAKNLSVAAVYILILGILIGIISFVIPQLIDSVRLFANSFDGYYDNFMERIEKLEKRDMLMKYIGAAADELVRSAESGIPKIAEKAYSITSSFAAGVANVLISAAVSVYLLADKERFILMAGRLMSLFMPEEKMYGYVRITGLITGCFSRFICGQLTEAAVLGVLCFAGMLLFGFSYPLLISAIIGITALVPVVGALIGTIPSALMLFMIKPSQAVWFTVFIIILQQLENSVIYPKVVGKSVGLPPLIILIAIIIGAGLGGAAGIMAGIPTASAIYLILREKISGEEQPAS